MKRAIPITAYCRPVITFMSCSRRTWEIAAAAIRPGWIAVSSLMVYVGSFAVGLGPVFWLMLSEIYPLRIRGRAMSVGTVANWGANLIVALSFLRENIRGHYESMAKRILCAPFLRAAE